MRVGALYVFIVDLPHLFSIENFWDLPLCSLLVFFFYLNIWLLVVDYQKVSVFQLTVPKDGFMEDIFSYQESFDILRDIDDVNNSLKLNLPQKVFNTVLRAFSKVLWVLLTLIYQSAP